MVIKKARCLCERHGLWLFKAERITFYGGRIIIAPYLVYECLKLAAMTAY
jgi:hypothetical protein